MTHKVLLQIQREFWECKSSLIKTPLLAAGVLASLLLLGVAPWHYKTSGFIDHHTAINPGASEFGSSVLQELAKTQTVITETGYLEHGLAAVYVLFTLLLLLVLTFYFADALYNDRRDQSILFWKSMPVSEWQVVLAKIATGIMAAPAVYAGAALVTGAFFLITFMVYAGLIWSIPTPAISAVLTAFFKCSLGLLFGWCLMALWYLPIFIWLLFSSAFVRKTPFLMALGAPIALVVLEKWVLGSHIIFQALFERTAAGLYNLAVLIHSPDAVFEQLATSGANPQFWLGLGISAALLPVCVWLRNNRWEL